MSKANNIYYRAFQKGITLECTCVGITQKKWDKLMEKATRANKRIVEKLVRTTHPDLTDGYNPYNHYKTETHIIFVHSSIEHFFRIN